MRFFFVAWASRRCSCALTMALSRPRNAAAPVLVVRPGICGGCGLATAYACPHCKTAHFCAPRCLERVWQRHTHDCGEDWCKAVDTLAVGTLAGSGHPCSSFMDTAAPAVPPTTFAATAAAAAVPAAAATPSPQPVPTPAPAPTLMLTPCPCPAPRVSPCP